MAIVTVETTGRTLSADSEVASFLAPYGVEFERWPIPEPVEELVARPALSDADQARVLDGFRDQLDALAQSRGYVQADMVVLHPETPGLDAALARFDKIHYHTDEEVRFIVDGRGIFGFEGPDGHRFTVEVHAGEYIVVPDHAWHWFTLCDDRRIKAIRLFQDTSGWTPHYRGATEGDAPDREPSRG